MVGRDIVVRTTRRVVERLEPFSLPQQGLVPLALPAAVPKHDNRADNAGRSRTTQAPREKKKATRRS
jgi:hypothetical protein